MIYGIITESILALVLFILYLRARGQAQLTVERNTAIEQENLAIQEEN